MNPALKHKIINSGDCVYCGLRATCIDHVLSKKRGGTDDEINLVPCCQICNSSKAGLYLSQWDIKRVIHGAIANPKVLLALLAETEDDIKAAIVLKIIGPTDPKKRRSAFTRVVIDINDAGRYSLREIAELQIVPMTYAALRKVRQRNADFPAGLGTLAARKYTKDEIQTWFNNRYYRKVIA